MPHADPPLHLAMELAERVSAASSCGLPSEELCVVVIDVAIAACRASGMDHAAALELFAARARRPVEAVPPAPALGAEEELS